jgi:hypothetical protein
MNRSKWCFGSFLSGSFLSGSLALALALGACGGDDDGSGVDGDKTLDQLSDAEVEDLCEWSFDLVSDGDAIRFACYLVALSTSEGDPEACETLAQACVDDAPPIDRDEIDCTADVEELPACAADITVAELEACSEGTADLVANLADEISCDSSPDDVLDFEAPAACIALEEQCPELFDDADPEARLRNLSLARRASLLR